MVAVVSNTSLYFYNVDGTLVCAIPEAHKGFFFSSGIEDCLSLTPFKKKKKKKKKIFFFFLSYLHSSTFSTLPPPKKKKKKRHNHIARLVKGLQPPGDIFLRQTSRIVEPKVRSVNSRSKPDFFFFFFNFVPKETRVLIL